MKTRLPKPTNSTDDSGIAESIPSIAIEGDHPKDHGTIVPVYEQDLGNYSNWALREGSRHFDEKSAVFDALQKVASRLEDLNIPYAVVGGMALFVHGVRRFTEDVDLLVTREDLKRVHEGLDGLGYVPLHRHSKNLRDAELGVRIEFLMTGDYPGDGKEKPVRFPDPRSVIYQSDGINYLNLETLVELKLASGMTTPSRLKDLSDVLELIKVVSLPADFSQKLNPYVRDKYMELWQQSITQYVTLWSTKLLTPEPKSIEAMIARLHEAVQTLEAMRSDGVRVEDDGTANDYVRLVTNDPEVAKKYDMIEKSELWEEKQSKERD